MQRRPWAADRPGRVGLAGGDPGRTGELDARLRLDRVVSPARTAVKPVSGDFQVELALRVAGLIRRYGQDAGLIVVERGPRQFVGRSRIGVPPLKLIDPG